MIFRYLVFQCFYFFIYLYVHNVRQKIPNVTVAQCFELVCKKIKGEFYCIIHIVIQFSVILSLGNPLNRTFEKAWTIQSNNTY